MEKVPNRVALQQIKQQSTNIGNQQSNHLINWFQCLFLTTDLSFIENTNYSFQILPADSLVVILDMLYSRIRSLSSKATTVSAKINYKLFLAELIQLSHKVSRKPPGFSVQKSWYLLDNGSQSSSFPGTILFVVSHCVELCQTIHEYCKEVRITYISHFVLVAFWFEVDVNIRSTQHNGRLVIRPVKGAIQGQLKVFFCFW